VIVSSIKISPVREADIAAVHAIAEAWTLENLETPESGFLVSSFSLAQYQQFLSEPNVFVKAEVDGEIVGFLYGFSSEHIKPSDIVNSLVRYNLTEPYFVIKQVCIARDHPATRGVAATLYDWVKAEVGGVITAAVVLEPANPRSIAFHEKQGFKQWFELEPPPDPDGATRLRGIWCYLPHDSSIRSRLRWHRGAEVPTHLVDYHTSAVQLYTHEDNLNWTKLGMNVTFMMAMLATVPYLLSLPANDPLTWTITAAVITAGFLLNGLFGLKLRSGLEYMQFHKASVQRIEQRLSSGYDIPPLLYVGNRQIARESTTANALRRTPWVTIGLWTLTASVLVTRLLLQANV
jgi:predicted GNAT superfamily acetyltransferase